MKPNASYITNLLCSLQSLHPEYEYQKNPAENMTLSLQPKSPTYYWYSFKYCTILYVTYQIKRRLNTSILRLGTEGENGKSYVLFVSSIALSYQAPIHYITLTKVKEKFQREVNNLGRSPGKDKAIGWLSAIITVT